MRTEMSLSDDLLKYSKSVDNAVKSSDGEAARTSQTDAGKWYRSRDAAASEAASE